MTAWLRRQLQWHRRVQWRRPGVTNPSSCTGWGTGPAPGTPASAPSSTRRPCGRPWNPDFISDPSYIAAALAATGSRLLLDLAHVRIAAWHRGQRPSAYLSALPLDWVDEVHVVGTATVDGELRDKHVEMDEEDYAALAFVLERAPVHLVTLEYGGVSGSVLDARSNPEALARQLGRLRQVLAGARGAQGR
ncbi:MAG: multinuclear nonheme iron-dependent oxidase [Bacillota bacterium]